MHVIMQHPTRQQSNKSKRRYSKNMSCFSTFISTSSTGPDFVSLLVSLERLAKCSHGHEPVWLLVLQGLLIFPFPSAELRKNYEITERNRDRRQNKPPRTNGSAQLRDGKVPKSLSRGHHCFLCAKLQICPQNWLTPGPVKKSSHRPTSYIYMYMQSQSETVAVHRFLYMQSHVHVQCTLYMH